VLERECQQVNAAFFALVRERRPYVTLKWAQTADGFVAGVGGRPMRISGVESTRFVHQLRTRCDAIAVSADTVISDDPQLTVRDVPVIRRPAAVVLDTHLRTPETARVLRSEQTLVFTAAGGVAPGRAQTVQIGAKEGHVDLHAVLAELGRRSMTHLLVEPGARLAKAMLAQNLADRVIVIASPRRMEIPEGLRAAEVPFAGAASMRMGEDSVTEYLNPASSVFFAMVPSADFRIG
jgi:diaminohydroxyphosphoribosylaminopyrimidine deaminase/5-amino-6-(5-phosphoribosylamino)uracil reductase